MPAHIHSEQFNTSPRQIEWNDEVDAIIECDRDDRDSGEEWCALHNEEKTTFSTNEPLLLGEIYCNRIYIDINDPEDLESELRVDVKIIEERTLDGHGTNAKLVSKVTANLDSDWKKISLTHPILIRPNYFYTISTKGFPKGHCFESYKQKTSMTLGAGGKIKFHNDETDKGLIYRLHFNEI